MMLSAHARDRPFVIVRISVFHNGLAVNKAGLHRQAFHRRDNAREAVGEVPAMPGVYISWIQSRPAGGSLAGLGRQGVMMKQGRKERDDASISCGTAKIAR